MPRLYFLVVLIWPSLMLTGQASYQAGYLIDHEGMRREIEVYDFGWVDNPVRFKYRTADGQILTGDVTTVAEFGLADESLRYLTAKVEIDSSRDHTAGLDQHSKPQWVTERVFLEYVVDGEADLFYWEAGERKRYFYRLASEVPVQLVNRRYLKERKIITQHNYRGQLQSAVFCPESGNALSTLKYTRRELADYFQSYNACTGNLSKTYRPAPTSSPLQVWLGGGMGLYTGPTRHLLAGSDKPIGTTYSQTLGLTVERILPLAKQRWAVHFGAQYQRISSTSLVPPSGGSAVYLQLINVPFGVKRYIHLSARSAAFIRALGVFQVPLDGMVYSRGGAQHTHQLKPRWNYQVGISGGLQRQRWSVEVQGSRQWDMLREYAYFATAFWDVRMMINYRLR
ncbi:hypothetical protein [Lewinella sp. JB7]|uniref:hypothetical protein n=1 Tax=Lewinella sp. JB7 TaxID=2962887 RepID=UPI0020C9E4B0|nr:hypothetical protein [Lewinella sp. JB7]MCP9235900.1 hypothetical protein [Lewinella sp. JB7]